MTFCLGINTNDGLVAIADTRVLAGNECLVARKVASYAGPGFSFFIMTSGLRSLSDKVLLHFEEAFARDTAARDRLYKTVKLYSQQVRKAAEEDRAALHSSDLNFNIQTLVGGQMAGDSAHRLFLVYPEGNWVDIGADTPYQIIGASGYGKPILGRFDPLCVQGRHSGVRRDAAVRGRCRFPNRCGALQKEQLRADRAPVPSAGPARDFRLVAGTDARERERPAVGMDRAGFLEAYARRRRAGALNRGL